MWLMGVQLDADAARRRDAELYKYEAERLQAALDAECSARREDVNRLERVSRFALPMACYQSLLCTLSPP